MPCRRGGGSHTALKSQILVGLPSDSVEYALALAAADRGTGLLSRGNARRAHNAGATSWVRVWCWRNDSWAAVLETGAHALARVTVALREAMARIAMRGVCAVSVRNMYGGGRQRRSTTGRWRLRAETSDLELGCPRCMSEDGIYKKLPDKRESRRRNPGSPHRRHRLVPAQPKPHAESSHGPRSLLYTAASCTDAAWNYYASQKYIQPEPVFGWRYSRAHGRCHSCRKRRANPRAA